MIACPRSMSPLGSFEYRVICISFAASSKGSISVLSLVSSSSIYSPPEAGKVVVEWVDPLGVRGRRVRTSGDIGRSVDVEGLPANRCAAHLQVSVL